MSRCLFALALCLGIASSAKLRADDSAKPKDAPKTPAVVPQTPVDPKGVPADFADWTPRPATGKAEAWEKATDKDWIDPRFRLMNTGPFLNASIDYPYGSGRVRNYKGTAIKLGEKGDTTLIYDRVTGRFGSAWSGGFLAHTDRRFGLLNNPTMPAGATKILANPAVGGWSVGDHAHLDLPAFRLFGVPGVPLLGPSVRFGKFPRATAPGRDALVQYRGMYLHGDRVVIASTVDGVDVLESPTLLSMDGEQYIVIDIQVGPTKKTLNRFVATEPLGGGVYGASFSSAKEFRESFSGPSLEVGLATAAVGNNERAMLMVSSEIRVAFPPSTQTRIARVALGSSQNHDHHHGFAIRSLPLASSLTELTKPGASRWGKPIITKLERGKDDGPFAIDTLTIPYQNPFGALFFCTGVDFLADGRIAMSTCHGDVWLAKVDEERNQVAWQRFATGLYQPLGLKVVDGKIVVLERGQLTRLHDSNGDGEADFYENVCNLWHIGDGQHSYDTCLETDPQGNFYFFKTGDPDVPNGGCLMRVSKDGKKAEVFSTGFRHPIGLGASPTGIITGADQEGNWMPATRIDEYKKGGFYGDMRTHQRSAPPKIYDGPLCWLPREVDNSAGGQVWVPPGTWGPLGGLPLHLSYGRCKGFVLLRQEIGGLTQGGVADLGWKFLSGVCRGRFHPTDGHLYVCGLNGWQTAAQADGCLQRVRATGKPLDVPVKMTVIPEGIELTFSRPLERSAAENPENYRSAWWNYIWSKEYGSKRYSVADPEKVGQDEVPIVSAKVQPDGRTVRLSVKNGMVPAMQMQVGYNVKATDGKPIVGSVFLTVHKTGAEK